MITDTPPSKHRSFRPRRTALLLVVLACAIGIPWFSVRLHHARKQGEAVAEIRKLGGWVVYNCRYDESGWLTGSRIPGPVWLKKLLGVDFFGCVHGVKLTEVESLEGLGKFQLFGLPRAEVTDAALAPIEGLTDLQWLALSGTQVGDAGLKHLEPLTNLEKLYLDRTRVTDAGLEHLRRLTRLKLLSLSGTQVSDAGLAHLGQLTSLKKLRLDGTRCTFSSVVHLLTVRHARSLPEALEIAGYAKRDEYGNVLSLDLSKTQLADPGLAHVAPLDKLQWLFLGGTQVTDAGLAHLKALTTLELLHLAETRITDAGLEHLYGLKNLRTLHLTATQVTGEGVAKLRKALPETLRIYWKPPPEPSGVEPHVDLGSAAEE